MFSFQDNVPEYYMKESRDFQLFPRLDDILFLGVHQDINTLNDLNNPKKCKNNFLKYLAEKVGFYTNEYIPDNVLINIISAFRTVMKNKGTKLGIKQAVITILKAENSIDPPQIIHITTSDNYWERYTLNIYTPVKILNQVALREFLKYIIPAGYNFNIYTYKNMDQDNTITITENVDYLNAVAEKNRDIGVIRNSYDFNINNNIVDAITSNENDNSYTRTRLKNNMLGTIDSGVVVSGDDYKNNNGESNSI